MSLTYAVRESISGFRRGRIALFVSVLTTCIALLWLGLYYLVTVNAQRLVQIARERVEMEAFCEEPISRQRIGEIQKQIGAIPGVASVRFVSKEEAARIFKQEFGEEVSDVLDFNPLPPSFKLTLKDDFRTSAGAKEIAQRIEALAGIDGVLYRHDLLEFLDERLSVANALGIGLGIIIGLSAIVLVSNTIRLAIYSKRKIIQTMKLVGATRWFIRLPFLLEGIMQGLIGGLVASGIFAALFLATRRWLSQPLIDFLQVESSFYLLILIAGTFLGLLGSLFSVRRFIGETIA